MVAFYDHYYAEFSQKNKSQINTISLYLIDKETGDAMPMYLKITPPAKHQKVSLYRLKNLKINCFMSAFPVQH